jgi:hypothetical protein
MGAHSHSRSLDAFLHPQDMAGLTNGISVPSDVQPSPPISSIKAKGANLSAFSSFLHEQSVHEGLTHSLTRGGAVHTVDTHNYRKKPSDYQVFRLKYDIPHLQWITLYY